jgi:aryl-alcohol dehydrogenase-like predicted oxidoreductase
MIETNRIALGSVQFGLNYGISNNNNYKPSINEVQAILDFAFENQINFLDTANAYGDAEQIIGALNNKRFNVITKFLPESQNGLFENQFNQSLDKLQAQSLYGLLAHRPMDVVKNPLIWKKMNAQKENLHVSKIGFSFENVEEYFAVMKKSFIPDLVQVPFNYFDDRFIAIIEDLKNKGCEIHTRSSFLQGLFFADTNLLPSFFADVKEIILNFAEVI